MRKTISLLLIISIILFPTVYPHAAETEKLSGALTKKLAVMDDDDIVEVYISFRNIDQLPSREVIDQLVYERFGLRYSPNLTEEERSEYSHAYAELCNEILFNERKTVRDELDILDSEWYHFKWNGNCYVDIGQDMPTRYWLSKKKIQNILTYDVVKYIDIYQGQDITAEPTDLWSVERFNKLFQQYSLSKKDICFFKEIYAHYADDIDWNNDDAWEQMIAYEKDWVIVKAVFYETSPTMVYNIKIYGKSLPANDNVYPFKTTYAIYDCEKNEYFDITNVDFNDYSDLISVWNALNIGDDAESEYNRLGVLLEYFTDYRSELGAYSPYEESYLWQEVNYARAIYENSELSEEEYRAAADSLLNEFHSMPLLPSYARSVVQKANQIKNVNNYYNKSDWSDFQRNIALLQSLIGTATDESLYYSLPKRREITNAFHDLLNSYNRMTLQDFVQGDADGSGKLTVEDVTTIQRYLANMTELSTAQVMRSSVDSNKNITIGDVTKIQRLLAEFKEGCESPYAYIGSFETSETEDYLYERLFNYTLCPETLSGGFGLPKVFYDTVYYQDIYKYCSDRGFVL